MASDSRAPRKPPADESVDSSTSSTQPWRPKANPWLIAVVVAMAAFMEVLDTSIANVALPYMAGNLGASNDESTWILTSYLVSNAIVLPISGWFASVLGRKRFFLLCLVIFTISSLLCGMAPSLGAIILFRVLQGAGGGGLQPVAQSILADTFPPQQRGLAFALYGITSIIAPTVGPTLGGWITDNYTWRWIFFINLPVGILTLFLVLRLVEDPPWMKRLTGAAVKIDYIGVALLTLGVGALQVMLDKGQEDDWFGSHFILFHMPVAGVVVGKFQARYIIGFGWLVLSLGMYYSTRHLDLDISFWTASFLRVVQVFGLAFLFVPINIVSYVGMPADKSNSVAGLVNFMRNIGSSIGTSMVTTLIARRAQFHQVNLVAHTSPGQPTFTQSVEALAAQLSASGLEAGQATSQAYARVYQAVIGQATTLAYIDTFWVLCLGAAIMFGLSFALKRNKPGAGGEVAVG